MKLEIELADDVIEQKYELRIIADRYDNASDLEGIYNLCKSTLKHDADPIEALKMIKEIAFRNYGE